MRKSFLPVLVYLVGFIILIRLINLQIFSKKYDKLSIKNSVLKQNIYPERGFIFDRNGKLLVSNQPMYDLMVIPNSLKSFDTTELSNLTGMEMEKIYENLIRAKKYSIRAPSVLINQIPKNKYAGLQEKMWKFPGMYIQRRSARNYETNIASNILGYISEVNNSDIKNDSYYEKGELIGRQGVEKTYEKILRGKKGVKYLQRDKFSRIIGPYKNGELDTLPVKSNNVTISVDMELQEYGSMLLKNKRGGVLAIEPESGEILLSISSPAYNPNLLVGRQRSENFKSLKADTLNNILFDRSLQGQYAPGSPFKVLNALIGLEEGVISENDKFLCNKGHFYGNNQFMECRCPVGSMNNLNSAIHKSCNTYFSNIYQKIINNSNDATYGTNRWSSHLKSFGLGNYLGYDHPVGQPGFIPDGNFYNLWYPNQKWSGSTIVSNSIGQGEVLVTPIQLANIAAIIGNKGYYYKPHFIKAIDNYDIDLKFSTKNFTTISSKNFIPIIQGMKDAVKKGTAKIASIPGIDVCGKTGTIENFTKINGVKTQLTDHSMFIAFAPCEKPKIAIAVIVENGYWGGRWAAPIASLIIEKYLNKKIKRSWLEKRMVEGSLQNEYMKVVSNKPFTINE